MLILIETAAGYGLFKMENNKLLEASVEEISKSFGNAQEAKKHVSLHSFKKFKEIKKAVSDTKRLMKSKMGKELKKFLKKNIVKAKVNDKLAVSDKALGGIISKKFNIKVAYTEATQEIIRGIKSNIYELLIGTCGAELKTMQLSLSHSLNRFKLKFSKDKVDIMIVQSVGLLEDLDKEINVCIMKLKEWYGWHFPELAKIVGDNKAYCECILKIGMRTNTKNVNLLEIVTEEMEKEIKQLAEISIGTEVTDVDIICINDLAQRMIQLIEYRDSLHCYIRNRMIKLAPNLSYLVGESIGAKLIARAGTLMNLAKFPSSTLQVLGSERALFRALKTKSPTPKYGLIYHATLVGQCIPKIKGKVSRSLASKLSLCARVDAFRNDKEPTIGIICKEYMEKRVKFLSNNSYNVLSRSNNGNENTQQKYNPNPSNLTPNIFNENEDEKEVPGDNKSKNKNEFQFKRNVGSFQGNVPSKKFIKKQKRK